MQPIIFYDSTICKILTFGRYTAITLLMMIFFKRSKDKVKQKHITHETIHVLQQLEMLCLGTFISIIASLIFGFVWWFVLIPILLFYIFYALEYIIALPFNKLMNNDSYHTISFEEEAYCNEDNIEYPDTRKLFAWVSYLGNVKRYK